MSVENRISSSVEIPLHSKTIIHCMLVHNAIAESLGSALKPFDVSMQQFNVLRILRGQKGKPANLSTINERMITKMSNTTRLVDKLLLKGFLNRMTCPVNRRKVEITITDKGKAILLEMDQAIAAAEKELLKNFTKEDLEELNDLLYKF